MNILAHCASKLQSKKIPNKPPRKSKHCNSALLFQLQRRIILNYDFSSTPSATTDLSFENSIQTIQFRVMLQIYPTFQQRLSLNISIRRSNAAFVFFAANIKQFILICHCALALLHDTSTKYLIHLKNVTRKKKEIIRKIFVHMLIRTNNFHFTPLHRRVVFVSTARLSTFLLTQSCIFADFIVFI